MTIVYDTLLNHERDVGNIANRGREAGATEEGIVKAVPVASLICKLPALVAGCNSYRQ